MVTLALVGGVELAEGVSQAVLVSLFCPLGGLSHRELVLFPLVSLKWNTFLRHIQHPLRSCS